MKFRYPITSGFQSTESFRKKAHNGIDFAMKKDTELRTIKNGTIEKIVNQPNGLGKAVYVKWNDGKTAIYAHMNKISVSKGDKVKVGDLLGYSGSTGNVVGKNGGYHLHFAVKDKYGSFIDPKDYVKNIQQMNHELLDMATETNTLHTFIHAMKYYSSSLQEINLSLNTFANIKVTSINYSPLIKSIQYFF